MNEMSESSTAASRASTEKRQRAAVEHEARAFGGPIGAVAMMALLPLLSVYLWACVHRHGGALVWPDLELLAAFPVPSARALLWVLGWILFQVTLDLVLPGRAYKGLVQRDGRRLIYRLNGLLSLGVTLALLGGLIVAGVLRGSVFLDELGPLLVTAILVTYAFSAFLYVYGKRYVPPEPVEGNANTRTPQPNLIYDYFMGTGLNPRIGKIDLKMCFESKIGMTTWAVLTVMMAHAEVEREGALSLAMLVVCLFQMVYIIDFFWFEEAMLSTWDINQENYGFMLAFAFLVWMPFNFSLQTQYLVYASPSLSTAAVAGLVVLNFVGYYIFRSANLQKHYFRTVPGTKIWGKEPAYIQTQRGTKLLASGWWGLARHCNYLGDLTMALAWCLACGASHIVPYFYFIYFAPLLIDRERRDDQHCADKYGDDWKRYCARVRYRILPYVY